MTTFLAVYGALLATILGVLEGVRLYLDRPRLRVSSETTVNVHGATMRVIVINDGRRTTTVREAGYKVLAHHEFTAPDGMRFEGERWIKLDGPPRVLEPGQPATFEHDFFEKGFPSLVHADFPLRAYVRDLRNRYVWGPALPIIRLVVRSGLRFPDPPAEEMIAPLPGAPLKPDPLYARWKVWRGLAVRDPLPLELRVRRIQPRRWDEASEIVTTPVGDDEGPEIY